MTLLIFDGMELLIPFIPAGNPEKYKEKAVLAVSTVVRYKQSLYFSLVPTL